LLKALTAEVGSKCKCLTLSTTANPLNPQPEEPEALSYEVRDGVVDSPLCSRLKFYFISYAGGETQRVLICPLNNWGLSCSHTKK